MRAENRTRRFGRTAGDELNILRASPFSIGFNSHEISGKNWMKKFKKYVLPFAKKHGLRTTGQSIKNYAEGAKPLDGIKSALGDEFKSLFEGDSKKTKKTKKMKKNKKKVYKKQIEKKVGQFQKIAEE